MSDHVLIDGDQAVFDPTFGAAIVVVRPGVLVGSGPGTHGGKPLCVDGDEGSVSVAGCIYITAQHTIAGAGTLEIASLAGDHRASKTNTGGTPVLLVGGPFTARFKVDSPAQQPGVVPVPDATPQYTGTGRFVTTNTKFKGL